MTHIPNTDLPRNSAALIIATILPFCHGSVPFLAPYPPLPGSAGEVGEAILPPQQPQAKGGVGDDSDSQTVAHSLQLLLLLPSAQQRVLALGAGAKRAETWGGTGVRQVSTCLGGGGEGRGTGGRLKTFVRGLPLPLEKGLEGSDREVKESIIWVSVIIFYIDDTAKWVFET